MHARAERDSSESLERVMRLVHSKWSMMVTIWTKHTTIRAGEHGDDARAINRGQHPGEAQQQCSRNSSQQEATTGTKQRHSPECMDENSAAHRHGPAARRSGDSRTWGAGQTMT